jgi:hypothetical protein
MRKIPLLMSIPALLSCACTTTHGANAYVAFGGGSMEHKTEGGGPEDTTSAGYFALGGEAMFTERVGAGLRLEAAATDDDLFAEDLPGTYNEAGDGDLFFHSTIAVGDSNHTAPLRVGLFLRNYTLSGSGFTSDLSWVSLGPRIEFAPDFKLIGNDRFRWSIPLRLGAGIGAASFSSDTETGDFDSTVTQFDLGIGTRFLIGRVQLDLGYLQRSADYESTDEPAFQSIDTTFSGLVFTVGAKF